MGKSTLKRSLGIGAIAGVSLLGVASCSGPNYSGEGNEFEVEGVVTDPGKESLKVEVTSINFTAGEADGWFEIGHVHQLHDNCDCHGTWRGNKQYGFITDIDNNLVEPAEVAVGACIQLSGAIRSNNEGKTWSERPVYEVAQIVECATE